VVQRVVERRYAFVVHGWCSLKCAAATKEALFCVI
jgi:hypothetical protein